MKKETKIRKSIVLLSKVIKKYVEFLEGGSRDYGMERIELIEYCRHKSHRLFSFMIMVDTLCNQAAEGSIRNVIRLVSMQIKGYEEFREIIKWKEYKYFKLWLNKFHLAYIEKYNEKATWLFKEQVDLYNTILQMYKEEKLSNEDFYVMLGIVIDNINTFTAFFPKYCHDVTGYIDNIQVELKENIDPELALSRKREITDLLYLIYNVGINKVSNTEEQVT